MTRVIIRKVPKEINIEVGLLLLLHRIFKDEQEERKSHLYQSRNSTFNMALI
jgi:hypothetical protein